jgi:hypothetical protein
MVWTQFLHTSCPRPVRQTGSEWTEDSPQRLGGRIYPSPVKQNDVSSRVRRVRLVGLERSICSLFLWQKRSNFAMRSFAHRQKLRRGGTLIDGVATPTGGIREASRTRLLPSEMGGKGPVLTLTSIIIILVDKSKSRPGS